MTASRPEAVVLMGIQATGKSTFAQEHLFRTHVRINLDMLRTRHREARLLDVCLETRQSFVVDNTNVTREDRARYVPAARERGFEVVGYFFRSSIEEALQRNERRGPDQRVPRRGLRGAHARMELPSKDEGFDRLYFVCIGNEGDHEISEWRDEVR